MLTLHIIPYIERKTYSALIRSKYITKSTITNFHSSTNINAPYSSRTIASNTVTNIFGGYYFYRSNISQCQYYQVSTLQHIRTTIVTIITTIINHHQPQSSTSRHIKVFTIEINNINMVITSLTNIEKSRLLLLPTMETTAFITINPLYLFSNYHNHTFLRHHHHQFDNGYQHSCHVHRLYHIHFSNNINCYNGQPPVYSILRIFCTVMTQCSHFISYLTKK